MTNLNETFSEKKNFFNRLILIYIFFGFLFIYFLYKTFSLQVSSYSDYEIASLENKTREILVQPKRGIIFDRNGVILVNNTPSYNLIISPSKIGNLDTLLNQLKLIVDLSTEDIAYVNSNFKRKAKLNRELIVKRDLSREEIAKFEIRQHRFPGALIDERYSRENLYPELFSHSIGYVGNINDDQLEKILFNQELHPKETIFRYSNGYLIGKTGLENTYDEYLRGYFGKKIYEVDASGKLLKEIDSVSEINGKNIHTSLDLETQKIAYQQLNNRRGAVVAVDIENGAIVSYLSSPSFSVNKIANGLTNKEFQKLLNDKNKPFFDRAVQGRYSPASTIKPAIGLYGIEKEIIDWNYFINDPGFFILPEDDRTLRGWKKGGHGDINLKNAIIESSNTFFFSLAYQSDINELIEHLSNFGFGKNICIDCFLPDKGLLPSPKWKMNNLNFGWVKGDTVNLGVGQGYLSATPIQLAYYSAFLAKKGILDEFSFVQKDLVNTKSTLFSNNLKDSDWKNLHDSMIGVIDSPKGTAGRLKQLKDFTIAAKSGTVELVSTETKEDYKIIREIEEQRDHAIIIAFGPMPNPRYAVSVVIENGESGGSVAGPVAVAVLNSLLKK
ncbi:MAG: penicillin-binding protein 2 [Gammaproteobacteria bacterium]|nr:penicillin-binding protein 2 [Gammaproteobacteria bacterium]|tara:strand:- start:1046 stop:2884 length:1839 start_codon:yes stop_codon:yes gene_type:complete